MDAIDIVAGYGVQVDPSGVGHAWHPVDTADVSVDIAEEIACWIIEAGPESEPEPREEMTASNGQHYRMPPE